LSAKEKSVQSGTAPTHKELTAQENYNKGVELLNAGRHKEAIGWFEKALEIDPRHANAWNDKGVALANLKRHEEGIQCFDKALAIDPRHADAWGNKGVALNNVGRCQEALTYLNKALEIDPRNAYAWNAKGFALVSLNRHEEGIQCFDKALEIDPRHAVALHNKKRATENYEAISGHARGISSPSSPPSTGPRTINTSVPEASKVYLYRKAINEGGELPSGDLTVIGASRPVLKKGEVVHFAHEASAKETKTVSLGYRGGSRGISVPLPIKIGGSPIRFRVGRTAGHVQKEQRTTETSRGVLIITNKRLFLHPAPGHKPISIPLTKILSYQGFTDELQVYQEGRQTPYAFQIKDRESVAVFEACLGYLTSGGIASD
jgi:hypothetical protein